MDEIDFSDFKINGLMIIKNGDPPFSLEETGIPLNSELKIGPSVGFNPKGNTI